jgi:hypothetical protein
VPSWAWYAAPALYLVHALAMVVDEARFHRRRGLGRWERWGHPADTLTVLACYLLALSAPSAGLGLYLAAAVFSTLFVTKDEWIHAGACTGGEMWLHAFLFALHPVLLFLAGLHGWSAPAAAAPETALAAAVPATAGSGHAFFGAFLAGQAVVTGMFLLWQTLYWNGPWAPPIPATR